MKNVKIGLTTVTFRALSVEEIIRLAVQAGLNGLEIGGDVHLPPGDTAEAVKIRELTQMSGLEIFSYGSYYHAGEDEPNALRAVLVTADALGAKKVRIWTARRDRADFGKVTRALTEACKEAAKYGIELGMEYHNGTFNDTAQNSLLLLDTAGAENLFTYWQPLYGTERNLADIATLGDRIEHVHVYNWIYGEHGETRLSLDDPPETWRAYVSALGNKTYIMEFVQKDDPNRFKSDAAFLQTILKETVR